VRLGWFREKDFGDIRDEDEVHDTGKFRGTVVHRLLRRLFLERQVCLPADTTHKTESSPLLCLADLLNKANSIKWI